MRKILIATACLLASAFIHADAPQYSLSTQLEGLAIGYHVENSTVAATVYATNHEKFPVICDANMDTNRQEKSKGGEKTIDPEKTTAFFFKHSKSITNIRLYLVCEATKQGTTETTSVSASTSETTKQAVVPAQKTDADTAGKPVTVIEEDLDKH